MYLQSFFPFLRLRTVFVTYDFSEIKDASHSSTSLDGGE